MARTVHTLSARLRLTPKRSLLYALLSVMVLGLAILFPAGTAFAVNDVVRLSELQERYGLDQRRVSALSGKQSLTGTSGTLVLVPGGREIMANEQFLRLSRPVGCHEGDLLVPMEAVAFLDSMFRRAPGRTAGTSATPPPTAPVARRAPSAPRTAPRTVRAAAPVTTTQPAALAELIELEPLQPLTLSTPKAKGGRIVIDPGHGGAFRGAMGPSGLTEKSVNLAIASKLKALLEARGWQVTLTRTSDRSVKPSLNDDLEARIAIANRARVDVFVSIHANHAGSGHVEGYEVYYHEPSSTSGALARAIHGSIKARVDQTDRGVKTARFRVLRLAKVPAVLVETGFLSNRATEARLRTASYQRKIAEALADGVARYYAASRR